MVDRKPRVAVTLSDEALDLMQRLAALENTSASKVVASVVEEFLPVARQLVELGESAKTLTDEQREKLEVLAQAMEAGVVPKSDAALEAFNSVLADARGIVNRNS